MTTNFFQDIPNSIPEEIIEEVFANKQLRIERIISAGQKSADNFWYDQKGNEWVLVLQGYGVIEFTDGERVTLNKGDYLNIPAHCKHRVAETSLTENTIWLAVFYSSNSIKKKKPDVIKHQAFQKVN